MLILISVNRNIQTKLRHNEWSMVGNWTVHYKYITCVLLLVHFHHCSRFQWIPIRDLLVTLNMYFSCRRLLIWRFRWITVKYTFIKLYWKLGRHISEPCCLDGWKKIKGAFLFIFGSYSVVFLKWGQVSVALIQCYIQCVNNRFAFLLFFSCSFLWFYRF